MDDIKRFGKSTGFRIDKMRDGSFKIDGKGADLNKFAIDMKNYYGAEIKAESIIEKKHDGERKKTAFGGQDKDIKDRPGTQPSVYYTEAYLKHRLLITGSFKGSEFYQDALHSNAYNSTRYGGASGSDNGYRALRLDPTLAYGWRNWNCTRTHDYKYYEKNCSAI